MAGISNIIALEAKVRAALEARQAINPAAAPLYCVCETREEGREVVARYRDANPQDRREVTIVITGIPSGGIHGPASVQPWTQPSAA